MSFKTDDLNALQGVQVLTSAQYFAQFWGHVPVVTDLYESVQQSKQAAAREESPDKESKGYRAHWSTTTVDQGLKAGTVFQVCDTPWRLQGSRHAFYSFSSMVSTEESCIQYSFWKCSSHHVCSLFVDFQTC